MSVLESKMQKTISLENCQDKVKKFIVGTEKGKNDVQIVKTMVVFESEESSFEISCPTTKKGYYSSEKPESSTIF
mgnify:CR=1 FL=1